MVVVVGVVVVVGAVGVVVVSAVTIVAVVDAVAAVAIMVVSAVVVVNSTTDCYIGVSNIVVVIPFVFASVVAAHVVVLFQLLTLRRYKKHMLHVKLQLHHCANSADDVYHEDSRSGAQYPHFPLSVLHQGISPG